MNAHWSRVPTALAAFLFASLLSAQFEFPPREHEDMEARLTVQAAKRTPQRGLGEATLTLTVAGPATLDVEAPRLGDAAAAWKEERLTSTRMVQNQRAVWSQIIRLKQVKHGLEPLPDVSLRFRRKPEAGWIEEKWIDILRHVRTVPRPVLPETPPVSSWLRRWGFLLILAATALLVLLAWRMKRRGRLEAPLRSDQWALREIERIERTLTPPQGEAETYHTQMSYVVRRYLTERFGLHALQQTTAEFLDAVRDVPPATAALLGDFLQRCDLAKFARAGTTAEECRRTAELARELVRRSGDVSL